MDYTIKEILTAIGFILTVVNYIPYLIDVVHQKTKPHCFTWFIWALLTGIAFAGQWADHGGMGALIIGFSAIACVVVTLLSLKYGEKVITRGDVITFIAALLTIPLWLVTKTPLYSMILVTLIDMLGFYPTWRKSWHKPQEETLSAYTLAVVKFSIAIIALENYTVVTVIYPASLVVINGAFVIFLLWRRIVMKNDN